MSETETLKALAHRVLDRDGARDSSETLSFASISLSFHRLRHVAPFGIAATEHLARIVPHSDGEAGLERPCSARRGRVVVLDNGAFLHFCCQCGRFAAFGYGVRLRAGQLGRWYCGEHRPRGRQT